MKKERLPSLSKVKKFLKDDWGLRVKMRDGFACKVCGSTENLTAHHWYICDHFAHAARYAVDNGVTLCYACHIRGVHTRADFVTVNSVAERMARSDGALTTISTLAKVKVTTEFLRGMWKDRRRVPIDVGGYETTLSICGKKTFLTVRRPFKIAFPGHTIRTRQNQTYKVLSLKRIKDGYRYAIKEVVA